MLPENREVLRRILTYHIVARRLTSSEIIPGSVPTMEGESIEFHATDTGRVTLQGTRIVQTNVVGRNGVIHAVDRVLSPKSVIIENYARR